jgi:TfoX N-terminal domain
MARDPGLEQLIREELDGERITEKAMFGGQTFVLDGNLLCGARRDGMLVRLGKGNDAWALALPGIAQMLSGGREMQGWVRASPQVCEDAKLRRKLLAAALAFVRTLPPK